MSIPGRQIRKQLKVLENDAESAEWIRSEAKKESGRLTQFGRDILAAGKKNSIQQAAMARLLGISPGAVNQHYKD